MRRFLSYNSADFQLAEALGERLKNAPPILYIFFAPKSLRAGGACGEGWTGTRRISFVNIVDDVLNILAVGKHKAGLTERYGGQIDEIETRCDGSGSRP